MTGPDTGDLWAYRCGELRHLVKSLLDVIDSMASESGCVGVTVIDSARDRLAESTATWQARAAAALDRSGR